MYTRKIFKHFVLWVLVLLFLCPVMNVLATQENKTVSETVKNNGSIRVYTNIKDMTDNFSYSDRLCYVLYDDSVYASGYRGNYYEFSPTGKIGEIQLKGGGYAILVLPEFAPLKSNHECIGIINSIAKSYCGVGIKYKAINGPFFRTPSRNTGIQCSQFVNAVLQGLYCQKSKLADSSNTNELVDGGCKWIRSEPWVSSESGCMSANELAHYAAAHGWLSRTKKFKNTEPGDVVFFQNINPKYMTANWNGIIHCAIVVARDNHRVVCLNAGGISRIEGLLSQRRYYPGVTTDAVNYQIILNDESDFYSNNYGLYGFARFPLYFKSSDNYDMTLDIILNMLRSS